MDRFSWFFFFVFVLLFFFLPVNWVTKTNRIGTSRSRAGVLVHPEVLPQLLPIHLHGSTPEPAQDVHRGGEEGESSRLSAPPRVNCCTDVLS